MVKFRPAKYSEAEETSLQIFPYKIRFLYDFKWRRCCFYKYHSGLQGCLLLHSKLPRCLSALWFGGFDISCLEKDFEQQCWCGCLFES